MLDSLVTPIFNHDWSVLLVVGAILVITTEIGFRLGERNSPEGRKTRHAPSGALQGALLGLLGLLLGFTLAMAVNRFEARKQLVLEEANAIGTTWLRAGFLSDPAKETIRSTLMDYIDARVKGAVASTDAAEYQQQVARSEKDQVTMWRATVAELKVNKSELSPHFVDSLNSLINFDVLRQAAIRNQVPRTVWLLLLVVSMTVCAATGYTTGLGESGRFPLAMIVLPILLTVVIMIISDLDNPRRGLIQVSQQSMLDLQKSLQKYQ